MLMSSSSPASASAHRIRSGFESLEGAVGLEHRIEMPDEQQPQATSGPAGNEMARAAERSAVDPLGLEAKFVELGTQHVTHGAHASEVE